VITVKEAMARRAAIEAASGDPEKAHSLEDALRTDVLEHIYHKGKKPRLLAAIALSTDQIQFPRWTA
jgi:hypothetical protein